MEEKWNYDRECPDCEVDSMVEHGISRWICLKCNQIFDEEWLDNGEVEIK